MSISDMARSRSVGTIGPMTTDDVLALGEALGLDAVGVARAEAYVETERHIRDRRERGLFGSMKFTTARPDVSCHPEALLDGARTVVSAALCYWEPEPERPAGHGRLARYTWSDRYTELRERLDALGRALGGDYRVLVDANQHVDREAAARSGVGFYGKNTMLITRRHGSWVVLGTLVTTADLDPTEPLAAGCGDCTLCIDACPTAALDEPRVLVANRCLSWSTQASELIPLEHRRHLGAQVYGCDICQDVCPWNKGVEKRRSELPENRAAHVDLRDWLERDGPRARARARPPVRDALVALGNVGTRRDEPLLRTHADAGDPMLREHAEWALAELDRRGV